MMKAQQNINNQLWFLRLPVIFAVIMPLGGGQCPASNTSTEYTVIKTTGNPASSFARSTPGSSTTGPTTMSSGGSSSVSSTGSSSVSSAGSSSAPSTGSSSGPKVVKNIKMYQWRKVNYGLNFKPNTDEANYLAASSGPDKYLYVAVDDSRQLFVA